MNLWMPNVLPTPRRLPNGDAFAADGTLVPFAASCPPGTGPNEATRTCLPEPGAINVNYGCGGAFAPLGTPGCERIQTRAQAKKIPSPSNCYSFSAPWQQCACGPRPNPWAGHLVGVGDVESDIQNFIGTFYDDYDDDGYAGGPPAPPVPPTQDAGWLDALTAWLNKPRGTAPAPTGGTNTTGGTNPAPAKEDPLAWFKKGNNALYSLGALALFVLLLAMLKGGRR